MNDVLEEVLADLKREGDRLEGWVVGLTLDQWRTPTPAVGWDIATQIAHLTWTDEVAVAAASDKQAWDALVLLAIEDPTGFVDTEAHRLALTQPGELLERWQAARRALSEALRAMPAGEKMPWFGPPMSATSMATARFMETWAHALDVAEALGISPEPTDRIRHVAHIGVRTRNFAFANNGLAVPAEEFRVELVPPSVASSEVAPGATTSQDVRLWTWGPADAEQRVTGSAYDFCLRVTQRRHRDDLDLVAVGAGADRWLDIAQAFAGPSGSGREAMARE